MSIAKTCRRNLLAIAKAYAKATGLSLKQIGHKFYGRSSFFGELQREERSISLDKFDELVESMRGQWPTKAKWPDTVPAIIDPPKQGKTG